MRTRRLELGRLDFVLNEERDVLEAWHVLDGLPTQETLLGSIRGIFVAENPARLRQFQELMKNCIEDLTRQCFGAVGAELKWDDESKG